MDAFAPFVAGVGAFVAASAREELLPSDEARVDSQLVEQAVGG